MRFLEQCLRTILQPVTPRLPAAMSQPCSLSSGSGKNAQLHLCSPGDNYKATQTIVGTRRLISSCNFAQTSSKYSTVIDKNVITGSTSGLPHNFKNKINSKKINFTLPNHFNCGKGLHALIGSKRKKSMLQRFECKFIFGENTRSTTNIP